MKITTKILMLLFVLMASTQVQAASIKSSKNIVDGINYQLNAKKQTATVIKNVEPYVGDIVIPEKITVDSLTFYVEEIASGAFAESTGMTSIQIAKTVCKIGSDAFKNCTSLTEITIPEKISELHGFWHFPQLQVVGTHRPSTEVKENS